MSQYLVYKHRDAHRQAILLKENAKFKTVMLQFLDDMDTKEYSSSTFKRYWKKTDQYFELNEEAGTEEEVVTEDVQEETTQEIPEEEVAGDGTPYAQVMQEILHDEELAVTKKKAKKQKAPVFDSTTLQEYAISVVQELGGDYVQRKQNGGSKDMAQKVFRAGGKMFMHMSYPRYHLRMDTRGVDTEQLVPDAILTGFYDARYVFTEDTQKTRSKIKKILTQAYKAQLTKNNKKGKGDK